MNNDYQRQPLELFYKKDLTKFTGKHLCWGLFFNKVSGVRPKKRLQYECFLVNFTKFLRTPFLQNTSARLLLDYEKQWLLLIKVHLSIFLPNGQFHVQSQQ